MTTAPPPRESGTLDFARAFSFVPQDPDWIKKLLIGGAFALLSMLLVGIFFVTGYWVRLIRRAARGEQRPLPEWDDLGGIFADGLKPVGAYLAWTIGLSLPFLLAIFGVAVFGGGLAHLTRRADAASGAMGALTGVAILALYATMTLASLALMVYLPAALARLALEDRFGAAFEIGQNFGFIRRNLLNYVLALVIYLVASVASQLGILLCCVGLFPAAFWALCILGFALGEVARRDAA